MRKGKQGDPKIEGPIETPARDGYEKRYVVDHNQTELFHLDQMTKSNDQVYHVALGAKEALKSKYANQDVRIRLRLRSDCYELQLKLPKEVKRVANVASQTEVLQTQTTSVASQ